MNKNSADNTGKLQEKQQGDICIMATMNQVSKMF